MRPRNPKAALVRKASETGDRMVVDRSIAAPVGSLLHSWYAQAIAGGKDHFSHCGLITFLARTLQRHFSLWP
jgi:hypothetical protein